MVDSAELHSSIHPIVIEAALSRNSVLLIPPSIRFSPRKIKNPDKEYRVTGKDGFSGTTASICPPNDSQVVLVFIL